MMLLASLLLGGLGLCAFFTLAPSLAPGLLGFPESVTDSKKFTINLIVVGPEVTVVGYSAPSELEAGIMPTVNVTVRHNRVRYEWIFARIRDLDTNAIVAPMKKQYIQAEKDFTFNFRGGQQGDWVAVMPNRDWNLQLEVGLWWL